LRETRRAREKNRRRLWLEPLEDRTLLTLPVPAFDPAQVTQALFGPDVSQREIVAPSPGRVGHFWEFAVSGPAASVSTDFKMAQVNSSNPTDNAVIALYDASGNLLSVSTSQTDANDHVFEELTTPLDSRKAYVLGAFFRAVRTGDTFDVTMTMSGQTEHAPLSLDLGTGRGGPVADAFGTPETVQYYPLNLLDGGAAGTLTVTPTGLNVNAFATLFRSDHTGDPWRLIAEGSGRSAFTLPVTPVTGHSLTDSQYVLAVAPQGFDTAARSYTVAVQAALPLRAPATVAPAAATELLLPPSAVGTAAATQTSTLTAGGQQLVRFHAPSSGPVTLTLQSTAFAPVLAVYSGDGNQLLAVSTSTTPGSAVLSLPTQPGASYLVREAATDNQQRGAFTFSVQASYVATDLPLNAGVTVQAVSVGPAQGARYYRLSPGPDTNILMMGVEPGTGAHPIAAHVELLGPDLPPVTAQVAAGGTLLLPVDVSRHAGPFDLYVASDQGGDPATLQIGQLRIPNVLPIGQLQAGQIDLPTALRNQHGGLTSTQAAGAFGAVTGALFYEPITDAGASTFTVQGTNGALPIVARYEEQAGNLVLADFALPNTQTHQATLTSSLSGRQLVGIAAYSIGFTSTGQNAFTVQTPAVTGVGVAMVPDLSIRPNFGSILQINNVALTREFQRDLWNTVLPFNLTDKPTVTFQPADTANQLSATITVYAADGSLIQLNKLGQAGLDNSETNLPGQPVVFQLDPQGGFQKLAGQRIYFQIIPVAGQPLSSGIYSLKMTVPTADPRPFEVREDAWVFRGIDPQNPPTGNVGLFPLETHVADIVQNQFGHGEAEGNFTSSSPYSDGRFGNPGSINVFRFWAINPGPVVVKSVPLPGSQVNSDLRVYKAHLDQSGQVVYLAAIDNVPLSLDWFQTDRSKIDAQNYINDFDLVRYSSADFDSPPNVDTDPYGTGGNLYYVVVKNQEGTQGRYKLVVDTASMPLVGINPPTGGGNPYLNATRGQVAYIPPAAGGSILLNAYLGKSPGLVGYFPIQVPDYHTGHMGISSLMSPGVTSGQWDLALFDAAGNQLPGTVTQVNNQFGTFTTAQFTVPDGHQIVYLRARSLEGVPLAPTAKLRVSMDLQSGIPTPPPAQFTGLPALFPSNPQGDGQVSGTLAHNGDSQAYILQAAAGPMTIHLDVDVLHDVQLTWGAYVNGNLIAWDLTGPAPSTITATILLPDLRQPLHNPDIAYDTAPYDKVVIVLQATVGPLLGGHYRLSVQTASVVPQRHLLTGDPFEVQTQNGAVLPMRDNVLPINPFTGSGGLVYSPQTITGLQWFELDVPRDSGSVQLTASLRTGFFFSFHYDLYGIATNADGGFAGQLLASDNQFGLGPVTFNLPPSVVGGTSYLVRVTELSDPTAVVVVTATATEAKDSFATPPGDIRALPDQIPLVPAEPNPDGTIFENTVGGVPLDPNHPQLLDSSEFWVGAPGMAHFDVTLRASGVSNPFVALYRGTGVGPRGEFGKNELDLSLVDFVNNADSTDGVNFHLDAYVTPGMYILQSVNNHYSFGDGVFITGSIPAYPVEEIVLDPNQGTSDADLRAATTVFGGGDFNKNNFLDNYRTTIYSVVTPGGSQGSLTVHAAHPQGDPSVLVPTNDTTNSHPSAKLTIWTRNSGVLFETDTHKQPLTPPGEDSQHMGEADTNGLYAAPGEKFFIELERRDLWGKVAVTTGFQVPKSGTPDLVVEPILLSPDHGKTRVEVKVSNVGYAESDATTAWLEYNYAGVPAPNGLVTSKLYEDPVPALGFVTHVFSWPPVNPDDTVTYVTNRDQPVNGKPIVPELDYTNDSQTIALKTKDKARPQVFWLLSGSAFNLDSAAPVWGRFVSDVPGLTSDVNAVMNQPDARVNLFNAAIMEPGGYSLNVPVSGQNSLYTIRQFEFGLLGATTGTNANMFRVVVTDEYGLKSDPAIKTADVVPHPQWLANGGGTDSSIVWDKQFNQYDMTFHNALLDVHKTLNDILNTTIPIVGDSENQFLAEITATGSASLDGGGPTLHPDLKGHVLLKVLGFSVLDTTYSLGDPQQVGDHLSFTGQLSVDPRSLEASSFDVTFRLTDLPLFNYESPRIPLISLGLEGIASVDVSIQFGLDVTLNAALTVGMDLQHPGHLFLESPTFIGPTISASATLSGDVEVIGVDVASLSGTVTVGLPVKYGLTTPPGQPVEFQNFADNATTELDLPISLDLKAKVLGVKVWGQKWTHDFGPLTGNGHVVTTPTIPYVPPRPTVLKGSDPVGPLQVDPRPNLVINSASGRALYVQTVDTASAGSPAHGNLAFAKRNNGTWSPLTTLPESANVNNPVLAETHDRSGAPAVVVYTALDSAGDPSSLTYNQYLTGQSLRSRYFDGTAWKDEQVLLNDGRFNADPAVSFSAAAQGVVAWVHNTNPSPVDGQGNFDRSSNEIEAAVWDPQAHAWLAPQALTANTVSDSKPAVFAAPDGTLYAAWLEDTPNGNQVMYSLYRGGAWSTPAILPISGMPAGSMIRELAIGSEGPGRLDVLLASARPLPDGSIEHTLYNRPSTTAGFGSPAGVEIVADHGNFAHLRALQVPHGGLLAYWQQSDGVTNEVFGSRLDPASDTWSSPLPLTSANPQAPGSNRPTGTNLPVAPSVAIDTDGRYQVVYQAEAAPSASPSAPPTDQPVGVPSSTGVGTSSVRQAPNLIFSQPMFFPDREPMPINVQTAPGNRTAVLNWNAFPGAASYNIYRATASGQEVRIATGVTGLSYSDPGLSNGQTYFYQVSPVNLAGEGARSSEISATPQALPPSAPANIQATAGDRRIALSWAASPGAVGYNIYRATASGQEVIIAAGVSATSYSDINLTDGATYYYQVSTVNAGGEGPRSREVSATPQGAVPAPLIIGHATPDSTATSGSTVTAQAQVVNHGPVGAHFVVQYFQGLPGSGSEKLLGSDVIYLGPGQSYPISHAFVVQPGVQTYAIRAGVRGANGGIVLSTSHVTSATLTGMADLAVGHVNLSDPNPRSSEAVGVAAEIDNLSDQVVGAFKVNFYLGDPLRLPGSATLLGTQTVSGLAARGKTLVTFPWTVPAAGGDFLLTILANPDALIAEADYRNDDGHAVVTVLPDATVLLKGDSTVGAVLLNNSGVNNVSVTALISNVGRADLTNVPVALYWAVDDGSLQKVGSVIVPSLPAGAIRLVNFTANGLAGSNRYRVVVDPDGILPDSNRSNNGAETVLSISGLADLKVGSLQLAAAPQGNGLVLNAEIDNMGIAAAQPVPLEVYVVPVTPGVPAPSTPSSIALRGRLVGKTTLTRVGPLAASQVRISLQPFAVSSGEQLFLVIDRLNTLVLSDRTHTVASLSLATYPPDLNPDISLVNGALTVTSKSFGQFHDDVITLDETKQGGVEVVFNGEIADFAPGLVTSITVNENDGNDLVNVEKTPPAVPATVNLGAGRDQVSIAPTARFLNNIGGLVTVHGGKGTTAVAVNDQSNLRAATWTATGSEVVRVSSAAPVTSPPTQVTTTIDYTNLTSLTLNGGSGGNKFSLPQGPLGIPGGTTIAGRGIADDLSVNDQADSQPSQWTITASSIALSHASGVISGLPPAVINYRNLGSLEITEGSGDNVVDVQATSAATTTTITASGNDAVKIGNATDGVGDIQGALNIAHNPSSGGYTALTVDDSAYRRGYWWEDLTESSLTNVARLDDGNHVAVAPITFNQSNLSSLKILLGNSPGGSGNIVRVFNTPVSPVPGGLTTTITTGTATGANDQVYVFGTTGALTVNLNNDGLHPASGVSLGANRTLDHIMAPVTVNTLSGWTGIAVFDDSTTTGQTYTLTGTTVTRGGRLMATYHTTNAIFLYASKGTNTINVQGTSQATIINAGWSNDTINVGNAANTLDDLKGGAGAYLVFQINKPGSRLVFNDQGSKTDRTYTLTTDYRVPAPAIFVSGVPNEFFLEGPLAGLVFNGGQGHDIYNIETTFTDTTVNGGLGGNIFRLSPVAQSLANLAGLLTIHGGTNNGAGNDILEFFDARNPKKETYTFSGPPSALSLATVPVTVKFSGMRAVYLMTNHMSTVQDPSGTVIVDPVGGPP
jgi:hypothetical protein